MRLRVSHKIGVGWWIGLGVVVGLLLKPAPGATPAPAAYPTVQDSAGYVLPRVRFLARIFHAVEEHQSLSSGDHVVIDAGADRQLQIGDWFTIVRMSPTLHHPVTGQAMGSQVAVLGYAVAVRVQPSAAMLRLVKTFDAVELGDQVIRFAPPQNRATRTALPPPSRDIRGYITATKDAKVSVGEGDIVYLDRGRAEGVRVGDRFSVFREGDRVRHPITRRVLRLPRQVFGELTVLDVRDHTATALISSSRRELSAGAPVELQDRGRREVAARTGDTGGVDEGLGQMQARLARVLPCLEAARRAIRTAEATGVADADLALARSALASAEQKFEQARTALAGGDIESSRRHLDAAQADCLTARDRSQHASAAGRTPEATARYTVRRGDSLWGISGQPEIYRNPFMWPMLYRANRDQIRDPDLIFPKQIFAIPRGYSREEADMAIHRARKRGPWRLGDGPDVYILEGVRP